jgi:hypothetical protein
LLRPWHSVGEIKEAIARGALFRAHAFELVCAKNDIDRCLQTPEWSRLGLWDSLRARWLGFIEPDPVDRTGKGFRHD